MHITDWIRSKFKRSLADVQPEVDALWRYRTAAARVVGLERALPIANAVSEAAYRTCNRIAGELKSAKEAEVLAQAQLRISLLDSDAPFPVAVPGVHPEPIDDAMSQAIRMFEVSDQAAKDRN